MGGQVSAGVLCHRRAGDGLEVLIAHPGGPFWANRDDGAWSIPKGLIDAGEDPRDAAIREFEEETGCTVRNLWLLGEVTLRSGKRVIAFAGETSCRPEELVSNTFELEWPPRSGVMRAFPEIDRIAWVAPEVAIAKLNPAQAPLVATLIDTLSSH